MNRNAVIDADGEAGVGAAADHDGERVAVGSSLGHEHRSSFEGVGAATDVVVDLSWDIGQGLEGSEGPGVEDAGFVVVRDEYVPTARKHRKEGIQVVRVSAIKEVEEHGVAACRSWKNFESGHWLAVGSVFTTNNENGAVG